MSDDAKPAPPKNYGKAVPKRPSGKANQTAAATNDERAGLVALRDTLAKQLDTTTKAIHAQLAPQYAAVLKRIAEIDAAKPVKEGSALDELQQRRVKRAARKGTPADRSHAAGRRKPGNS